MSLLDSSSDSYLVVNRKKVFFYLICFLLFSSPWFLHFNISFQIQYILLLVVLCAYFVSEKKFILPRKKAKLFLLFFVLIAIDKLNDFFLAADLLQIIPAIYSCCIIIFFLGISKKEVDEFWEAVKKMTLLSSAIATLIAYLRHIPLGDFDRDVSAALYVTFICYCFSEKKRYLILLLIIFIELVVFEARTLLLSFTSFLLGLLFFRKCKRNLWKIMALVFELIVLVGVTYGGIEYEKTIGMRTPLFTGRGLLWDATVQKVIDSDSNKTLILGAPTTTASLEKNFGGIMLDPRGWDDNLIADLKGGHFHNGLIYTFYNTGVLGCILLLFIFLNSFKLLNYNYRNLCAFLGAIIIWILNGRSLNGIYLLSAMMMVLLLVPINSNKHKK